MPLPADGSKSIKRLAIPSGSDFAGDMNSQSEGSELMTLPIYSLSLKRCLEERKSSGLQ